MMYFEEKCASLHFVKEQFLLLMSYHIKFCWIYDVTSNLQSYKSSLSKASHILFPAVLALIYP